MDIGTQLDCVVIEPIQEPGFRETEPVGPEGPASCEADRHFQESLVVNESENETKAQAPTVAVGGSRNGADSPLSTGQAGVWAI
jgi:hypothetical protein